MKRKPDRQTRPDVAVKFLPTFGLVTNIEPLPDDVLERIYAKLDEEDEKGVCQLMAAQAFGDQI